MVGCPEFMIYGLIDPRDNCVFYVGQTTAGAAEPEHYVRYGHKTVKRQVTRYLRRLHKLKIKALWIVLEEFPSEERLDDAECFWIASIRAAGASLTNMLDGGQRGFTGKHSEESKQKIRDHYRDPSFLKKFRESAKSAWTDPVNRESWLSGRSTTEAKEKHRKACKDAFSDPDLRKGRSERMTARWSKGKLLTRKEADMNKIPDNQTTLEQARIVVDRVSAELGFVQKDTSGYIKIQNPSNRQRVYVKLGKRLTEVATTLPLATDDPDYVQLRAPNGSIHCEVPPTLEALERILRRMADPGIPTQVPNKPRPFAATKAPAPRKAKPVVAPVPAAALVPLGSPMPDELKGRLKLIHERGRELRIVRLMEADSGLSRKDAEAQVDARRREVGLPVPEAVRTEETDAEEAAATPVRAGLDLVSEDLAEATAAGVEVYS